MQPSEYEFNKKLMNNEGVCYNVYVHRRHSMKQSALVTAGTVFLLVSLVHLARLYFHFTIIIGTVAIPLWINIVGFLISAALSYWMFYASKH